MKQFKCVLAVATILAGLAIGGMPAAADNFPSRTVRIIVPFSAGGANDGVARAVAERLSKKWGQSVVVENRPGGATTIGTRAVIESEPDGHTLLFTSSSTFVVTPHTTKINFDPLKDLEPISMAASIAPAMAIGNNIAAKTVPELIAYAKANPGKLTYASAGRGTYSHVAIEHFKKMAGIDMVHVPYSGTSKALTDMLGGRIDVYMVAIAVFKDLEKSGKLKIAAMGTQDRHPDRPDLPTIGEAVPGYAIDVWFGFSAPAKTPAPVLDKVHKDITEILNDPEFVNGFVKPQGFTVPKLSREQFAKHLREDYQLWGTMVENAGMKKQP